MVIIVNEHLSNSNNVLIMSINIVIKVGTFGTKTTDNDKKISMLAKYFYQTWWDNLNVHCTQSLT
jgi:hypothetical protein